MSGGISRPVNRRGIALPRSPDLTGSLATSDRAGRRARRLNRVERRFDRRPNAGDDFRNPRLVRVNPVPEIERGLLRDALQEKRIERDLVRFGESGVDAL